MWQPAALICQCLPLSYPETMLFIRYYQRQLLIKCLFLYQCMGSNYHGILFCFHSRICFTFLLCGQRTGKKNNRKVQFKHGNPFLKSVIMLSCQNLSWCHNCSLITFMSKFCHNKECKNGLTGAYIPLYQPLHGIRTVYIFFHIFQCFLLGICQWKRKLFCHHFNKFISYYRKSIWRLLMMFLKPLYL